MTYNNWISTLLLLSVTTAVSVQGGGATTTTTSWSSGTPLRPTAFVTGAALRTSLRNRRTSLPYYQSGVEIEAPNTLLVDILPNALDLVSQDILLQGPTNTVRLEGTSTRTRRSGDGKQQQKQKQEQEQQTSSSIFFQEPKELTTTLLEDVEISFALPVIVKPKKDEQKSLAFLQTFLLEHQEWIDLMMQRHGAVLFRDFGIDNANHVEDAILAYNPHLNNQYRGTSPRNVQGGTDFVFSAAEVPSHYPIAQHLEMSFLPSPPKQLYFSALQAPKTVGGETSLADFRKVYQDLPEPLRTKLQEKKLRYTRTHHKIGAKKSTHDVAAMLSWPELFGTSDKNAVEQMAKEEGTAMKWQGKNQDVFVSQFEMSEPFQLHPKTNEPVWFNHAQVFHWTTFPAELFAAFRRTKDWRIFGHAMEVSARSVWKYGVLRQKMALHVSFGDGTPISVWEMHQIRKAVHDNMVYNRWQQGDLLMIDNFSTSHGRQPTYDKGRKIVVAWSDPRDKENKYQELQSSE